MEYMYNFETGVIDFAPYSTYLESIRHLLPAHVYAFASNSNYYDLESPGSLHDSWLETLTVRENASGDRREARQLEIHLCLYGPYHDRWINLRYIGVTFYSFHTPDNKSREHTAHGDLLTHEIRLGNDGLLIHEILFTTDATLLIECKDIVHSEEIIK